MLSVYGERNFNVGQLIVYEKGKETDGIEYLTKHYVRDNLQNGKPIQNDAFYDMFPVLKGKNKMVLKQFNSIFGYYCGID